MLIKPSQTLSASQRWERQPQITPVLFCYILESCFLARSSTSSSLAWDDCEDWRNKRWGWIHMSVPFCELCTGEPAFMASPDQLPMTSQQNPAAMGQGICDVNTTSGCNKCRHWELIAFCYTNLINCFSGTSGFPAWGGGKGGLPTTQENAVLQHILSSNVVILCCRGPTLSNGWSTLPHVPFQTPPHTISSLVPHTYTKLWAAVSTRGFSPAFLISAKLFSKTTSPQRTGRTGTNRGRLTLATISYINTQDQCLSRRAGTLFLLNGLWKHFH